MGCPLFISTFTVSDTSLTSLPFRAKIISVTLEEAV